MRDPSWTCHEIHCKCSYDFLDGNGLWTISLEDILQKMELNCIDKGGLTPLGSSVISNDRWADVISMGFTYLPFTRTYTRGNCLIDLRRLEFNW